MGGGDLNLKKSWHPQTFKNIERVYLREKAADDERKKIDQKRKEIEEQRAHQELQALHEASGKVKKRTERLEWIYAGPAAAEAMEEDREAYLLGKKRIDKLVEQGSTVEEMSTANTFSAQDALVYGSNANTARDMATKVREDPLLAIKRREQASLQAIINNPVRLKALKADKESKKDKKKREKKEKKREKKEKKHKRRRHGEESDEEGERKVGKKDAVESGSSSEEEEDEMDRKRRAVAESMRHPSRRRDDSIERPSTTRHRETSSERRRSSPERSRFRNEDSSHQRDGGHRDLDRRGGNASRFEDEGRSRYAGRDGRDRSVERYGRRGDSRNGGGGGYENGRGGNDSYRRREDDHHYRRDDRRDDRDARNPSPPPRRSNPDAPAASTQPNPASDSAAIEIKSTPLDDARALRLAAMMQNAKESDVERQRRIVAGRAKEMEEAQRETELMRRKLKEVGEGRVHSNEIELGGSSGLDAADMIRRNRHTVQRGEDSFLSR
ncbi:RNA-splicing factor [Podochytrium sp. JEL0797]|nr:RNA-splicing factor [Podochytrium sp. JEL0797]